MLHHVKTYLENNYQALGYSWLGGDVYVLKIWWKVFDMWLEAMDFVSPADDDFGNYNSLKICVSKASV